MTSSTPSKILIARTARVSTTAFATVCSATLLLGAVVLSAVPTRAQDMNFGVDDSPKSSAGRGKKRGRGGKGKAAKPDASAPAELDLSAEPPAGESGTPAKPSAGKSAATGQAAGDDLISDLATDNSANSTAQTPDAALQKETTERVYAVPRVFAMRKGRLELAPMLGFTMNDQYVSHPSLGVAANYWFTNVLAVGASFQWYQGLENESDLSFHVRRSTRLAIPITEYQLGAHLNFTYVPIYGKFSMFNTYIFQWDAYVVGGVGTMRTRPVPVIDPVVRNFDYGWRLAFNAGLGLRVFLTRFLTVFAELRDYIYLEELENLQVGLGSNRTDSSTWTNPDPTLTNNVTAHLGFGLFIPFSFDYDRPK